MPVESANYINNLQFTYPATNDQRTTTDEHLRLIKLVIQQSFSNLDSTVSASALMMNMLDGVTSNLQTQINNLMSSYSELTSGSSTAGNMALWDGATKYVSTASASGGSNGDFWFQYE